MPVVGERKWVEVKTTRGALEKQVGNINTPTETILVGVSSVFVGLVNAKAGSVLGVAGLILLSRDTYYASHKNALIKVLNDLKTANDKAEVTLSQEYRYHVKGGWLATNNIKIIAG